MTYSEYTALFESILTTEIPSAPYDNADYLNYTKLNESRQRRWDKKGELSDETIELLSNIENAQHWIIISEPWCGDASHCVPFLVKMAEINPKITYDIQLRDSEPFLIEDYLTNGGKAIPKLIARDSDGNNLFVWGPRPEKAQELFLSLKEKNADFEELKIALQEWYNENKGVAIQKEIIQLVSASNS